VIEIVGDTVTVAACDVARGVCVSVSVVDLDCVRETVGELLSKGTVTVVKELLGVNEVVGVIEIGDRDGENVDVMVVVIDPYVRDTRGLAVIVIGDCDNVFVALTVADVLAEYGTLNVLRDDSDIEGCTVLVADRMGVKVDELRGLEDCPSDRVLRADID
jgi:hypothetical protein